MLDASNLQFTNPLPTWVTTGHQVSREEEQVERDKTIEHEENL